MTLTSGALKAARDEGYSDDDIFSHLSESDARIKEAKDSGYSLDDIASHFDQPKAAVPAPSPSFVGEAGKAFSGTLLPQLAGTARVIGFGELADLLSDATPERLSGGTAVGIAHGLGSAGALLAESGALAPAGPAAALGVPAVGTGLAAYESAYREARNKGMIPEAARQAAREAFIKTIPEMGAYIAGIAGGTKLGGLVGQVGGGIGKLLGRIFGGAAGGQAVQSGVAALEGESAAPTAESITQNLIFGGVGAVHGALADAAKAKLDTVAETAPDIVQTPDITQPTKNAESPRTTTEAPSGEAQGVEPGTEGRVRVRDDAPNRVETQPGEVDGAEGAQVTEATPLPNTITKAQDAVEFGKTHQDDQTRAAIQAESEALTAKHREMYEREELPDQNEVHRIQMLNEALNWKAKEEQMQQAQAASAGPGAASKDEPLATYEKRRFGERFQESKDISPGIREATGNRYYEPIPNAVTVKEAESIIEQRGTDESVRLVRDESFPMDHRVRSTMAQGLIKKLNQSHTEAVKAGDTAAAEGFLNQAVDTAEYLSELGTKLGQGVQSFAIWSRLTPEGMLMAVRRQVKKARTKLATESGGEIQKIIKSADESGAGATSKTAAKAAKAAADKGLWPQYREHIAKALAKSFDVQAQSSPALQEFSSRIVSNLRKLLPEGEKKAGLSAEQSLREVINNWDKYKDAWNEARTTIFEKFADADEMVLSSVERSIKELQSPADTKAFERVLREAMNDARDSIKESALEDASAIKQAVTKAIQDKLGIAIPEEHLAAISDAVSAAVDVRSAQQRERIAGGIQKQADAIARDLSDTLTNVPKTQKDAARELIRNELRKPQSEFVQRLVKLGAAPEVADQIFRMASENRRRAVAVERAKAIERREKEFKTTADRIARQLSDTPAWTQKATRDAARELIREHLKEEQPDFVSRLVKFGADRKTAESIDRMAAENRKRAIAIDRAARAEQLRKQYAKTPVGKKIPKALWEKVVELSDVGLLTEEAFYNLASERLGLPKFDKETVAELTRMATEIEKTPEGFQRNEKMTDFVSKVAELKGIDPSEIPTAMFYANILSGYTTQLKNTVDTALNIFSESAASAASHPGAIPDLLAGLYRGTLKGGIEAASILKTGRSRTENKLRLPPTLERTHFGEAGGVSIAQDTALGRFMKTALEKKPAAILNLWKYPLRAMVASDAVFYNSMKEARSRVLARAIAKQEGLSGDSLFRRVDEILNRTPEALEAARKQAESEGLIGNRLQRRINELEEQGRPEELVSNADEAAAIATYYHDPTGTLGVFAERLGQIGHDVPLFRIAVMPFVRIVANVANRGLDYTPWGYKRLFFGQHGGPRFATEPPVGEAYRTQLIKATAGTVGMAAVAALDAAGIIQITASGPQNPEERKQLLNSGWKPYSVRVGDTWLSYQYTPMNLGFAMVGHYRDAIRYNKLDEKDAQTRLAYGMLKSGSTLFDMTFLSGLSSFMETVSGATASTKSAGRMIARTGSSLVMPNLLKQIDRLFDPTLYDAPTVQQMLIRETPVARSTMLEPMLNVLGEPIKQSANPFVSFNKKDPVWKLIIEKQAFIPVPSKTRKVGNRPITPEEYRTLIRDSGQQIRAYIQDNLDTLRSLNDQEAQDTVRDESERIRKQAMRQFSE